MKLSRNAFETALIVCTTGRLLCDLICRHSVGLSAILPALASLALLTYTSVADASYVNKTAGLIYVLREDTVAGHSLGALCIPWLCSGITLLASPARTNGWAVLALHSSLLSAWAMVLFLEWHCRNASKLANHSQTRENLQAQFHHLGHVYQNGAAGHDDENGKPFTNLSSLNGSSCNTVTLRNASNSPVKRGSSQHLVDCAKANLHSGQRFGDFQTCAVALHAYGNGGAGAQGTEHRRPTTFAISATMIVTSAIAVGVSVGSNGTPTAAHWMELVGLMVKATVSVATLHAILRNLPRSFTIGEGMVLAQGVAFLLWSTLQKLHPFILHPFILHPFTAQHGAWPTQQSSSQDVLETTDTTMFVQGVTLTSLLATLAISPLLGIQKRASETRQSTTTHRAALAGVVTTLLLIAFRPALWFLQYVLLSPAHRSVLMYWSLLLALCLPLMLTASRTAWLPNILVRKGYHLLAMALFLPPLLAHPALLSASLAVAFALFVALEVIRVGRVPPLGTAIHLFMTSFIDYRDSGVILVSHFSLLLGMAVPVWLACSMGLAASGQLLTLAVSLSGLMMLGVCDTAACAIGKAVGRHPVYAGAKKTVEGTVGGAACTLLAWLLLYFLYLRPDTPLATYCTARCVLYCVNLAVATIMSSLLEAVTNQLDNIFLPLYYFALLCTL